MSKGTFNIRKKSLPVMAYLVILNVLLFSNAYPEVENNQEVVEFVKKTIIKHRFSSDERVIENCAKSGHFITVNEFFSVSQEAKNFLKTKTNFLVSFVRVPEHLKNIDKKIYRVEFRNFYDARMFYYRKIPVQVFYVYKAKDSKLFLLNENPQLCQNISNFNRIIQENSITINDKNIENYLKLLINVTNYFDNFRGPVIINEHSRIYVKKLILKSGSHYLLQDLRGINNPDTTKFSLNNKKFFCYKTKFYVYYPDNRFHSVLSDLRQFKVEILNDGKIQNILEQ